MLFVKNPSAIPANQTDSWTKERDISRIHGWVTIDLVSETVNLNAEARRQHDRPQLEASADGLRRACVVVSGRDDIRSVNGSGTASQSTVSSFFIREEFLCLEVGLNPVTALSSGSAAAAQYGQSLGREITRYVAELAISQRLVIRLLDLRSDDAARYGSGAFPRGEPNPKPNTHSVASGRQRPKRLRRKLKLGSKRPASSTLPPSPKSGPRRK